MIVSICWNSSKYMINANCSKSSAIYLDNSINIKNIKRKSVLTLFVSADIVWDSEVVNPISSHLYNKPLHNPIWIWQIEN